MSSNDRIDRYRYLRRTYLRSLAMLVLLLVVAVVVNSQLLIWVCISALIITAIGFAILIAQRRRQSGKDR